MFRKPKRKVKASLRRKEDEEEERAAATVHDDNDDDEEDDEDETGELLSEARKRSKLSSSRGGGGATTTSTTATLTSKDAVAVQVMHTFQASQDAGLTAADMATRVNEHHPVALTASGKLLKEQQDNAIEAAAAATTASDGIFRNTTRNKFLAGPIRAAENVRVTARFDYQPDICKDYKDTGFCGFGDTCIYLHDRGDTLTGWQLELQWQQEQNAKKKKQQDEMQEFIVASESSNGGNRKTAAVDGTAAAALDDKDGLPFACHLCRKPFTNPVMTMCHHYFCEPCIMAHVRAPTTDKNACPICGKDTSAVFNHPTKLLAKKRKVMGSAKASWEDYFNAFSG